MNTFTASLRSDRRKNPEVKKYRFLTKSECRNLRGRVPVLDRNGNIAEVTITSVKSWKTRPEIVVNWKFGLYEYGHTFIMNEDSNGFFVAEIAE